MDQLFITLHSYNRYLVMIALVLVLFRSFSGWMGRKPYEKFDNAASAALLGLTHLQLLLGLILYFFVSNWTRPLFSGGGIDMKDAWQRYFAMEHILMMIIAVVLIQLGRTFSKRRTDDTQKHRTLAIYTIIGTLIILASLAPKGLLFGSAKGLGI